MMRILLAALLAMAWPVRAQEAGEDGLMAAYRSKTQVVRPCDRSGDAIVVCGTRAERNARQRLPLPRVSDGAVAPSAGEAPRASALAVRQGSCGVVGGQGTGCVGGLNARKILSDAVKAIGAVVDPDADLSPPPPLPDRFKGVGQH